MAFLGVVVIPPFFTEEKIVAVASKQQDLIGYCNRCALALLAAGSGVLFALVVTYIRRAADILRRIVFSQKK